MIQVRHDHFEQIVDFAGNHVTGDNLRERNHRSLESGRFGARVAFDLHPHENRKPETYLVFESLPSAWSAAIIRRSIASSIEFGIFDQDCTD